MVFEGIVERYVQASAEFERRLRAVRPDQWCWPTPCDEWNVRNLVNHMVQGNLNYVRLAEGGSAADFLAARDTDVLGTVPRDNAPADPVGVYAASVRSCASAFRQAGVLDRMLDYPLGKVSGAQALAVRTFDSVIHTWDLAKAVGAGTVLDAAMVAWADDALPEIYAGLAESPLADTSRFFGPAVGGGRSRQDRLLGRMGRKPA